MPSPRSRREKRRPPQALKPRKKNALYEREVDGDRDQFERLLVEAARARVNRALFE